MNNQFHRTLTAMILFVTALLVLFGFYHVLFMDLAATNYIINGIIIGTAMFGICLCFYEMFRLLPEYNWLSKYTHGKRNMKLPPRILRPIALVLQRRPCRIYADALSGLMDMVANRFDAARESIRYITSTLVILGLLGTFWGLITTLGGFSELLTGLDLTTEANMVSSMQNGMSMPLFGMATAFTSSLLGLGASLIMGFLGHMVSVAHNAIYNELGDYMAAHTHTVGDESMARVLPNIDLNTNCNYCENRTQYKKIDYTGGI